MGPSSPGSRRAEHWLEKRTPQSQNRQRSGTGDDATLATDDELDVAVLLVLVLVVLMLLLLEGGGGGSLEDSAGGAEADGSTMNELPLKNIVPMPPLPHSDD